MGIKRDLYARYGVSEYWIVNTDAETVEVLVPAEAGYRTQALVHRGGTLNSPIFADLNLNPAEIF